MKLKTFFTASQDHFAFVGVPHQQRQKSRDARACVLHLRDNVIDLRNSSITEFHGESQRLTEKYLCVLCAFSVLFVQLHF
jgi:hypothetical protein